MNRKSKYLQAAIEAFRQKYSLREDDIEGNEYSSRSMNGDPTWNCEVRLVEEDVDIRVWKEIYEGEEIVYHSWYHNTSLPSPEEFAKDVVSSPMERYPIFSLRTCQGLVLSLEKEVAELEKENASLKEDNKKLREENLELLWRPGGKGYEETRKHFEQIREENI
ncbi:hypothetical protein ISTM_326 [Insectomime virus]|uniref:Uncharacterized protein n=1 Tax=Tunisvirus fontaine2 TaxID=1421067 RepID=V9SFS6_9VIRU|nr:hypothetical protein D1R32_gp474 [Tunisvirus fontaine2]AHA46224.1 hypothetical protein ISTM_326 [Insectomime virus]AHC55191.1 hypothetical protein TNS_ORF473 [Tunisvirus fontaine2]